MLTYRKKIFLDRTIGVLFSIIISIIARIVGFFLKRDHAPATNPRAVMVTKFVGLGSIIHSTVLCEALKNKFPQTTIFYLTSNGCAPLVRLLKGIDRILTIDDESLIGMIKSNLQLLLKMWRIKPELYFDLEVYSAYSSILSNLSLARNRYGFYRKSVTFKKGLFTHPVFFNTKRHISEIYGEMAKTAGLNASAISREVLNISLEGEKKANTFLSERGWQSEKIIFVNPNASELMYERRWPQENWVIYLAEVAGKWPNYIYILTGASAEQAYVDHIYLHLPDETKEKVFNMAGKWDLETFLALLKRARLLVTVDSGPLHMAVALGTPTISLWGPVEPDHYAPREGKHMVIYKPPYCSPCLFHADLPPCGGDNVCMKNISPFEVVEATERFFRSELKEP